MVEEQGAHIAANACLARRPPRLPAQAIRPQLTPPDGRVADPIMTEIVASLPLLAAILEAVGLPLCAIAVALLASRRACPGREAHGPVDISPPPCDSDRRG